MRLGKYEWLILWATTNNGGSITVDGLKEGISGHKSANSRTLLPPLYKQTERLNKAVIRACRSLNKKRLIFLEEAKPHHYSTQKKPVNVLLRREGLRVAQLYAMPRTNPTSNQVPYVSIITYASPSTIFTYDSEGQPEGEHTLHPITADEYLKKHTPPTP